MFSQWKVLSVLVLVCVMIGCTPPVYQRQIVTKYDANKTLIGYEVRESITQADPSSKPVVDYLKPLKKRPPQVP